MTEWKSTFQPSAWCIWHEKTSTEFKEKIRKTCFFLFAVNNCDSQTEAFGVRRGFLGRSGVPGHDDGITVVWNLWKWKWSVKFLEKVERWRFGAHYPVVWHPFVPLISFFRLLGRALQAGWTLKSGIRKARCKHDAWNRNVADSWPHLS